MRKLVIGVGNTNRGDDAAGLLVARRLRSTRALETTDCSDLIDLWTGTDDVTVVDAMRSGRAPGTVIRFDAYRQRLPARTFLSSHSFSLSDAVELARTLGLLPQRLDIYGIEGERFDPGATMSKSVAAAVTTVADEIDSGAG